MAKLLIAALLFGPALITWALQPLFKFDKGYIWIVVWLSFAMGAYGGRENHYYSRGGAPGIKIEPEQMIMVSVCFIIMAIWQYVIICKNRKTKNEPEP
jgi:hypothetical protein